MKKKCCFKCNIKKPLGEFYQHKRMADGYLNKCKDCSKKDVKRNRELNIGYYREYDKNRGNRQHELYSKEYREKYPLKYKAHNLVNNSIRDGKLFREPCENCGISESVHAHHDDYAKPLNVRWLCAGHHKQWHEENGEGKNAS